MCDDGLGPCSSGVKVNGLKAAAKVLVDIVVQADQSNNKSRIAVVPFSTRVRVERNDGNGSLMKKLTDLDPTWSSWLRGASSAAATAAAERTATRPASDTAHRTSRTGSHALCDRPVYGSAWNGADKIDFRDDAPAAGAGQRARRRPRSVSSRRLGHQSLPSTGASAANPSERWTYVNAGHCADIEQQRRHSVEQTTEPIRKASRRSPPGSTADGLATAVVSVHAVAEVDTIWSGAANRGSYADVTTLKAQRRTETAQSHGDHDRWHVQQLSQHERLPQIGSLEPRRALCTNMRALGIEMFPVGFALNTLTAGGPTPRAGRLIVTQGEAQSRVLFRRHLAPQIERGALRLPQEVPDVETRDVAVLQDELSVHHHVLHVLRHSPEQQMSGGRSGVGGSRGGSRARADPRPTPVRSSQTGGGRGRSPVPGRATRA